MTADEFHTKPVDKTELRTRVKTLVEKSERIRRQIGQKNRPLPPIISIIVAVIAATLSTIIFVTNEPITGEVIVKKEIEFRDVVREVEVVKEVVKKETEYRDVVKQVTVEKTVAQREFSSKEELEKWLAEDNTNEQIFYFVDDKGVPRLSDQYDCDDFALQLQQRASEDGFLMSVTITRKSGSPHMMNLVIIGNDIYYIEPQTDEVWFYGHLD